MAKGKERGRYAKTLILFDAPAPYAEIEEALRDLRGRRDVDASLTIATRGDAEKVVDAVLCTRATAAALVLDRLERYARAVIVASTVDATSGVRVARVRQATREEAFEALRERVERAHEAGRAQTDVARRAPRRRSPGRRRG